MGSTATAIGWLPDLGGLCAALNRTIDLAHENRLTRHQPVMFALADMMTHVEVGESMARLAVNEAGETHLAMARIFANTCARLVAEKTRLIVMGSDVVAAETADQFLPSLNLSVWRQLPGNDRRHGPGRRPDVWEDSMTEPGDRTVVVTGGSRGIGRAICAALAPGNHRLFQLQQQSGGRPGHG